jgi:hypothetical protein
MDRSCRRAICQDSDDRVESTSIAKPGDDERGVCPNMAVLMRQQGFQLRENARILGCDDCFTDIELFPEVCTGLKLVKQAGCRRTLLPLSESSPCSEQRENEPSAHTLSV